MYLGEIVEYGSVEDVFHTPRHPYTKALLSAQPSMDPLITEEQLRRSVVTPPIQSIRPLAADFILVSGRRRSMQCKKTPQLLSSKTEGHAVACHLVNS